MAESKADIDSSAPFASVKAAVSMFGERIPAKTHSLHTPHLPVPQQQNHNQFVGTYGQGQQSEVTLVSSIYWSVIDALDYPDLQNCVEVLSIE